MAWMVLAFDGDDEAAPARRSAALDVHVACITGEAQAALIGSVAVTRHADHAAAKAFWDTDPYVTGDVWRQVTLYGTQLRPLPCEPLPR